MASKYLALLINGENSFEKTCHLPKTKKSSRSLRGGDFDLFEADVRGQHLSLEANLFYFYLLLKRLKTVPCSHRSRKVSGIFDGFEVLEVRSRLRLF